MNALSRIVIIGSGAAGMSAASRAKRLKPSNEVIVIDSSRWVSFAFCGLPYLVGGEVKDLDELLYYPPSEFTKRGIDLRLNKTVIEVDPDSKKLTYVDNSTGTKESLEWDKLVLATGARSKAPKLWPEIKGARNVFYIVHMESGQQIRDYARSLGPGKRAVVVGAGYVGLEMADNLAKLGLKVTIIEAMGQVAPRMLDPELAKIVEDSIRSKGVEVVTGAAVERFNIANNMATEVVTSKGTYQGDTFVVGVGIEPNNELAKQLGLKLGQSGGVIVDERTLTSNPDVYAAGDVTEHKDLVTGQLVWRPFAQIANKMGHVTGSNLGGMDSVFLGSVGTSAFKAFDVVAARTGLSASEASKAGFKPVEVSLEAGTKAHYIPGGSKISLKVVADEKTGRLLGAQAVGFDESAFWRINVVASLLTRGGSVWDLFNADYGYQPLLSPAWDPLVIAARLLMRTFGERPW
ncbi:FAD-dependent oxidoreductase [Acidilobus sp.]|uniref:FAD-dependent oxidoreductase n=1 Tax=Acidilobus sp. TaxID=1872109 RepID=UPI003CFD146C